MTFTPIRLDGAFEVDLHPFQDERGWFARSYCKKEFKAVGFDKEWLQLNHSVTYERGSIRGMHFQYPPFREIKLVRCIAGAVFDVIVDLRRGSKTFLQWHGVELSANNKKMLYIPEGFAHGFQVLEVNSGLIYHHSEYYTPEAEGGFRYDDAAFCIAWPEPVTRISGRDSGYAAVDQTFKGI